MMFTNRLTPTNLPSFLHLTFQKLSNKKLLSSSIFIQKLPEEQPHQANTLSFATLHSHSNLEQTKQNHALLIKTFETHFNYSQFSPLAQYNFLISSYIKNNQPGTAVNVYAYMRKNGTEVDNFTLPTILRACSQVLMSQLGAEIHGFAVKNGLDMDVFVSNALIQMYGECGSVESSRLVFDKMADRDIFSWSTMIRSCHKGRLFDEALELIRKMQFLEMRPSEVAMINMVNLFADIANIEMGKAIHACVMRNGKNEKLGVALATSLIDMYAKCGNLASAKRLFDGLDQRSVVSWTAMIAGYIRCRKFKDGTRLFVQMIEENVFPSEITMLSLIIECGFVGGLEMGKWLHAYMFRNGCSFSSALSTALIDMYGKCGEIGSAKALFDSEKRKDVVIYSAMISAYAQAHYIDEAFELFVQMRESQVGPNEMTVVGLLSLCAEAGALDLGKWIHAYIEKRGVGVDVVMKTAVMDMYAKCGDIHGAHRLFSEATS
ncbi:pentatricopeptide repeat-containing protein At4g31070, mitochondrial-like [Pistacia vera]|uniref:pentatricopeptide repeat-containing protein At4g31070, mitochondrial-like n=1 Tax=Pistacia vera TaxID=55513 RepID=UPI0012638AA2|nr:pentatricopeptide repeat-containing protein At4g31070, mitochondrial-like [Pistacia vera]